MQWNLVFQDEALGAAWRKYFGESSDFDVIEMDICRSDCDAVVSPANSFGFMDGGLDLALSLRFGWDVQERLMKMIRQRPLGELLVGESIVLETYDARTPWLISAPTMRVPMRLRQSVNAYLAMKAILLAVRSHDDEPPIQSVAIPGLGTGCGALSPETAALQMWTAYEEVELEKHERPQTFGEAQHRHVALNAGEINLWD